MIFSKYLLKLLPLMMLLASQLAPVSAVTFSPLPNATISVGGENGEGFAITESNGIFTITQGLGTGNYAVEIYHPGYVSRMLNTIITAGAETDLGDIELRVSGSIHGVVTDPGGNPTSNITVQCKDESSNTPVGYAVTEANGSFTFDTDIKNGTYTVEALLFTGSGTTSPAGYASNKTTGIQGTEGQTTSGVIVQLGPSGTISGTVKDKSNVPIENVSILASGMQSVHGGYATTNPQGEYMIDSNLPNGTYKVYILNAQGYVYSFNDYKNATVTPEQTTTVDFLLDPSGIISGNVTLANDAPAPNTVVSAFSLDYKYYGSATTNNDGQYRIDSGLATGQYVVTADENMTDSKNVNVTAGIETPDTNFRISKNLAWIAGTISNSTGNPIRTAGAAAMAEGISGFTLTDEDGKYNMEIELPEGQNSAQVNVTALARGYIPSSQNVTINLDQTTSPVNFTLQMMPSGTLKGRIVIATATPEDLTPPNISDVSQTPPMTNISPQDIVKINATVTDETSGVQSVTLNYTAGNGTWTNTAMSNLDGNLWSANIPAFPYGTNVTYMIIARDNANNTATTPSMAYQYQVIPEFPTLTLLLPLYIMSALLIFALRKRKQSSKTC
jgi:hypothetical protein